MTRYRAFAYLIVLAAVAYVAYTAGARHRAASAANSASAAPAARAATDPTVRPILVHYPDPATGIHRVARLTVVRIAHAARPPELIDPRGALPAGPDNWVVEIGTDCYFTVRE